jgi:heat shock protein HtpX
MPATTFRTLIARNKRNSFLLVAFFFLFTVVVVLLLSLGIVAYFAPGAVENLEWGPALIVSGVAALLSYLLMRAAYYRGDKLILATMGAKPIQHTDDPELFNVVEEMAIAAGIPMPQVYLIEDSAPNAFATGRDPQHASVAITRGLRQKLTRDELQGVIAHEVSHIRNYDIRLMMLLAVLVGMIVLLADLFWQLLRSSYWTGGRRRGRSSKDGGGGLVAVIFLVVAVVLAIVAPLLAMLIQLAVSRQREYLADASAVELTRYPQGLANALRKIDRDPDVLEVANRGTAHLFIANPIKKFEARANSWFSSHPPIQERIKRLEALVK